MRHFLWRLWMSTFHLDSRVLRTFAGVVSPGKLTLAYFAGKQKKYFHPIQFFFVVLFFLVLSVSFLRSDKGGSFRILQFFGTKEPAYVKGQMDMRDSMLKFCDSLPEAWRTPNSIKAVDSLSKKAISSEAPATSDSFDLSLLHQEFNIAYSDILRLETDSLMQFYNVEPGLDRFLLKQIIRSGMHNQELGKFWIGTLSWSLLALIAVMAGWLKLLYIRRRRYFVEHFVLMLHMQTGLMVVLIIGVWLRWLFDSTVPIATLTFGWITVGYMIAFYRYYKQPFLKTFVKGTIFGFLYFVSIIMVVAGSLTAAILLF